MAKAAPRKLTYREALELWGDEAAMRAPVEQGGLGDHQVIQYRKHPNTRLIPAGWAYWVLRQRLTTPLPTPTPPSRTHVLRRVKLYTFCIEALNRLMDQNQTKLVSGVARLLESVIEWQEHDWEELQATRVTRIMERVRQHLQGEEQQKRVIDVPGAAERAMTAHAQQQSAPSRTEGRTHESTSPGPPSAVRPGRGHRQGR